MGYAHENITGHCKRVSYSWTNLLKNTIYVYAQGVLNLLSQCLLCTIFRLAYLHEGLEPKVVHRDIKSSNILLDRQWNPKVSDFGLAKLLCSENSYVTTRVMGTFGLV